MTAPKKRSLALEYLVIALAAVLMALNYQIFILHNAFAPSGINGLATMIQYLFDFSIGYMSLLINIPLAIFCFFTVNRHFALKTFTCVLVFSGVLLLMQNNIIDVRRFIYHTDDGRSTILAPIASGAVNGMIYATTIRFGGSTGGTDFIAAYVHKKRPDYSMMNIILSINAVVACLSYFVYDFNIEPVILCLIYNVLTNKFSDSMIKGGQKALKVEVITNHPQEITQDVIKKLRHSATIVHVEGGYSHTEKTMLICVINKHQITKFLEIIGNYPESFACITDVNQTVGNFKQISRKA